MAGLAVLVAFATLRGSYLELVSCAVFGISMVLLYLCSTIYHALAEHRAKRIFRILDHSSIYLLIAGTYTPFTLVTLRGATGWSLFGTIWVLALTGIVFKCYYVDRLHSLSTAFYVLMGWLVVVVVKPLLHALPQQGFLWLMAGGAFYTVGVVFFASKKKYAHTIWHLFVLAGSACHFVAVYRFIL